mmetsp:Transcript_40696/g.68095  ORF Transcript_40696/g.68095 Transcript_40696/m.68095 type:complete len:271 (-) Transcript_40696:1508-2320(-)
MIAHSPELVIGPREGLSAAHHGGISVHERLKVQNAVLLLIISISGKDCLHFLLANLDGVFLKLLHNLLVSQPSLGGHTDGRSKMCAHRLLHLCDSRTLSTSGGCAHAAAARGRIVAWGQITEIALVILRHLILTNDTKAVLQQPDHLRLADHPRQLERFTSVGEFGLRRHCICAMIVRNQYFNNIRHSGPQRQSHYLASHHVGGLQLVCDHLLVGEQMGLLQNGCTTQVDVHVVDALIKEITHQLRQEDGDHKRDDQLPSTGGLSDKNRD